MMKIGIISDTHSYLDKQVLHYFKDVDEIWHAGDIGNLEVTNSLAQVKKLRCGHNMVFLLGKLRRNN